MELFAVGALLGLLLYVLFSPLAFLLRRLLGRHWDFWTILERSVIAGAPFGRGGR